MKITETHKNGARLQISGVRITDFVERWRQHNTDNDDDKPKTPVGFVPNDKDD